MPSFIGFIPTPTEDIDGFFELVAVSSSDVVYDLGSGDGRLLFAALGRGAGRGVGVELDAERIRAATEAAVGKGLQDRVIFLHSDVMDASLVDASVVLCYLCSAASAALKPKFESELRQGARVVMECFPVLGWKPARTTTRSWKRFYLYVMPPESNGEEDTGNIEEGLGYAYDWYY